MSILTIDKGFALPSKYGMRYATTEESKAAKNENQKRYWKNRIASGWKRSYTPQQAKANSARGSKWYAKIGKHRLRHRRYGITPSRFDELWKEQKGLCAICFQPLTDPHVDHCHRTNQARGLLCNCCNHGIGQLRDDPTLLLNARNYLLKYQQERGK